MKICTIPDCGSPVLARGWCTRHYDRWRYSGDPLGVSTARGDAAKYYHEVVMNYEGDACLSWPYGTIDGYGRLRRDGHGQYVHRLVCEDVYGPAPTPEHEAAHSCGKGHFGCCAKRHISWKTRSQNQADRLLHGTSNRGERQWKAKLTEQEAREIFALKDRSTRREIAALYGVALETVASIHKGQSWGWLNG